MQQMEEEARLLGEEKIELEERVVEVTMTNKDLERDVANLKGRECENCIALQA